MTRFRALAKRYSHLSLSLIVFFWFIYTFQGNLPALDDNGLKEVVSGLFRALERVGVLDLLLVFWLWGVAYVIGHKFMDTLRISFDSRIERLSLYSAVGISFLSLAVFLLAVAKALYPASAYSLLILPTAVWAYSRRARGIGGLQPPLLQQPTIARIFSLQGIGHIFIIVLTATVLGIVLISALGPETEYDPLMVHLAAAKTFAQEHRLKAMPDIPQTFFPRNITMLFTLGMLLHCEITAKLLNYLFGVLTLLTTYIFARKLFSHSTGLVAIAILVSSTLFIWEMRTAHLDSGFTLFVSLSLYATITWLAGGEKSWFWLAVYLTAFSLGTRYQALFSLGSLTILVFLNCLVRERDFRIATVDGLRFFILSGLGLLPWGIVNLIQTRNPIFPFLNDVFQSPYWSVDQTNIALSQMQEGGVRIALDNWWALLMVPWQMTTDQTGKFHGNVGPFYLMLIPLLVFQRRIHSSVKLILGFSFFYWLLWLFTGPHLRYYLGALPGLAVVAAYAGVNWLQPGQGKTQRVVAIVGALLLAGMAVLNSPFFEKYGAHSRYGFTMMETLPTKYLLGQETRDQYLTRHVKDYPLIQHLNKLPGPNKVLFWWTDPAPSAFYLDGQAAFVFSRFFTSLFIDDPEDILHILQQNGVTHIVFGQLHQQMNLISNPEGPFVRQYLRKLYQRNAMVLYEVSPQPLVQDIVSYDFLTHIEEARITMPTATPNKPNSEYRTVTGIGGDDRYALLTFPPAEVEYTLTLPGNPLLRFAVGRKFPPCIGKGSFQVWLVASNGERQRVFAQELNAHNELESIGWFEQEVDLAEYANTRSRVIFRSESSNDGSCNWFLWADPVIVSRP